MLSSMPTSSNLTFPFCSPRSHPYNENMNYSLFIHLLLFWTPVINLLSNCVTHFLIWVCCQYAFMALAWYYFNLPTHTLSSWILHETLKDNWSCANMQTNLIEKEKRKKEEKKKAVCSYFPALLKFVYPNCKTI